MVKCLDCGLVRSDPVADPEVVSSLYTQSSFDYGREIPHLQRTYGSYLARLARFGVPKTALLEIGCGNGFFLEEALRQGFQTVCGVEPSVHAIRAASPSVRDFIINRPMGPGLVPPGSCDVICLFQVLDHIPDPAALLDECLVLLRPGGCILSINHNVNAVSARLMGERSPIVDVAHTYLFSLATMDRLFVTRGFKTVDAGPVFNSYSLGYLAHLLPLPHAARRILLAALKCSCLQRVPVRLPLGNLYHMAKKAEA
jgi:SAM-dependent methyltransferase